MIRLVFIVGALLGFGAIHAGAQCDPGSTSYYVTAYSLRNHSTVINFTQAYATGPNAQYSTMYVQQSDSLTPDNSSTYAIGSPLTASAPPGQTASNTRYISVATTGYGIFGTLGHMSAYRSCDGRFFPPYDNGFNGDSTASTVVEQPQALTNTPTVYPQAYLSFDPDGVGRYYPTTATLTSVPNGAQGTPVWTFQDSPKLTYSCTTCESPVATVNPTTVAGDCFGHISASYTLDGLSSTSVFLTILAPLTGPLDGGTTISIPGGYQTSVRWSVEDSCGNTWPYIHMAETFPTGFTLAYPNTNYPNTNWALPEGNSFDAIGDSTWIDTIAFSDTTGAAIPAALGPQSPLQNTLVFYGTQAIAANATAIGTQSQAHYQDHGGYR